MDAPSLVPPILTALPAPDLAHSTLNLMNLMPVLSSPTLLHGSLPAAVPPAGAAVVPPRNPKRKRSGTTSAAAAEIVPSIPSVIPGSSDALLTSADVASLSLAALAVAPGSSAVASAGRRGKTNRSRGSSSDDDDNDDDTDEDDNEGHNVGSGERRDEESDTEGNEGDDGSGRPGAGGREKRIKYSAEQKSAVLQLLSRHNGNLSATVREARALPGMDKISRTHIRGWVRFGVQQRPRSGRPVNRGFERAVLEALLASVGIKLPEAPIMPVVSDAPQHAKSASSSSSSSLAPAAGDADSDSAATAAAAAASVLASASLSTSLSVLMPSAVTLPADAAAPLMAALSSAATTTTMTTTTSSIPGSSAWSLEASVASSVTSIPALPPLPAEAAAAMSRFSHSAIRDTALEVRGRPPWADDAKLQRLKFSHQWVADFLSRHQVGRPRLGPEATQAV